MRFTFLITLLLMPLFIFGQNKVSKELTSLENAGTNFERTDVFSFQTNDLSKRSNELEGLTKATILNIDTKSLQDLKQRRPGLLEMRLPNGESSEIVLHLVQHDVLTPNFILRTSTDKDPIAYDGGVHYKGIVEGNPKSIVAISVFNNEVMGLISTKNGNQVLGRLNNSRENEHVLYNDKNLPMNPFSCEMEDDGVTYTDEQLAPVTNNNRDVGDCVKVYVEIDNDIVNDKGGATNATNYITGMFAQSIILYDNDNIDMAISEIFAWTSTSPYSSTSSSGMLNDFQANTGSFNGDLAHLVSYQASGGIAAGFSGICNSNPDNSKCFSSVNSSYSNVPTYSFSVMVLTHEMGHLIGSRHTHACVWNGNGTAIDGCSGQTEGSCSLPGNPSGGGTIMSYCHITSVGINFNLGFGPQPGNVVRNTVNAAGNCLTTCGGPPPPPAYCASNATDNTYEHIAAVAVADLNNTSGSNGGYGDFTSLTANMSAGNTYTLTGTPGFAGTAYNESWGVWIDYNGDLDWNDAGEFVGSASGSSAVSITFTVPSSATGTTRMRVSMQYNATPPLCGSFQYGEVEDYTVAFGGSGPTCTDGVQNGGETGVDCGGPDCPACPTCDDGVQNGDETDVDCGGPDCPACPTCNDGIQNGDEEGVDCGGSCPDNCDNGADTTLILGTYFETGLEDWRDGGVDCERGNFTQRTYEGDYSVRIRDNSGFASTLSRYNRDVSGYSSVELQFYFYPFSMETGEDFWIQLRDNSSGWVLVAAYASGTSFNNNQFYVATVNIPAGVVNFDDPVDFRFRCDASGNGDQIYIDAVTIKGISGSSSLVELSSDIQEVEADQPTNPAPIEQNELGLTNNNSDEVMVYPNPVADVLTLEYQGDIQSVRVVSMEGVVMENAKIAEGQNTIDLSKLPTGMYFVMIEKDGEMIPKKIMKM